MSTTHTPGPWTFAFGAVYVERPDSNGPHTRIALMDREEPATQPCERDANARLISVAPELLAALERVLNAFEADRKISPQMPIVISCETNGSALREARKAIAKAKGQR